MALTSKVPPPGRRLAAWRAEQDVSQADLGTDLGVSQSTVAKWERGRYLPLPKYRQAIAKTTDGAVPAAAWESTVSAADFGRRFEAAGRKG